MRIFSDIGIGKWFWHRGTLWIKLDSESALAEGGWHPVQFDPQDIVDPAS